MIFFTIITFSRTNIRKIYFLRQLFWKEETESQLRKYPSEKKTQHFYSLWSLPVCLTAHYQLQHH